MRRCSCITRSYAAQSSWVPPAAVKISRSSRRRRSSSDARLGDRHGDVARTLLLFEVAAIGADKRSDRVVLRAAAPWLQRRYRQAYEHHAPLDLNRIRLWEPAHLLHLCSTVLAMRSVLTPELGAPPARTLPIGLQSWAESRFRTSIATVS